MNDKINLPFLAEFKDRIIGGQKTATTRTRIMGYPLDWFEVFGRVFIITGVLRLCLWEAATCYYKEEGFQMPNEFIDIWKRIHRRAGYRPGQKVYIHSFKSQRELAVAHLHRGNPCDICKYPIRDDEEDR